MTRDSGVEEKMAQGPPPAERRVEEFKKFIGLIPPAHRKQLHFLPVVENGKHPDVPAGESTLSFRLSFDEAVKRLTEGKNVGIMFHADRVPLFCVDIDADELSPDEVDSLRSAFPKTLTVRTPGGGYHLYFLSTNLPRVGNAIYDWNGKRAGEIRANNYYVLAPGSVVNGKMYEIVVTSPPVGILPSEFPQITVRKKEAPNFQNIVDPASLSPEGFDPDKYTVPNTVWTFTNVLKHDGHLSTLLSISVEQETPIKVLDKEYPSQSEIDMAILSKLAYYGIPEEDAYKILKAYRYRGKLDRKDYLPRTWEKIKDAFGRAFLVYDTELPLPTYEIIKSIEKKESQDLPLYPLVLDILPRDHFISRYVRMAMNITDAYPEYHICGGLFILSVLAGPNMVFSRPLEEDARLYMLVIGRPAISHKSTAIVGIMHRLLLLKTPLAQYFGASEFSTEGFLNALASNPQQYFVFDEASRLFKLLGKSYASDVEEILLSFFNRREKYQRRLANKVVELSNPWVSIIGATTPSNFEKTFTEERVLSGLFSRFLFVTPDYVKEEKPAPYIDDETKAEVNRLIEWIEDVYATVNNIVGLNSGPIEVRFAKDGSEVIPYTWAKQRREEIMGAGYPDDVRDALLELLSRYQEYILRISLLISLGRPSSLDRLRRIEMALKGEGINAFVDETYFTVNKEDVEMAMAIVDKLFFPYARRLISVCLSSAQDSAVEKVYRLLHRLGGVATHSELLRRSHLTGEEFRRCINTLLERKDVFVKEENRGKIYYAREKYLEVIRGVENRKNA